MSRFEDLVETTELSAEEEARLRRVHELLVQAGPPPDLPPALERPPTAPAEGELVQFPLLPRRRWPFVAVAAAALVVLAFGGGYLVGHAKKKPTSFVTQRVVPMHGSNALALLRVAPRDSAGNWPMRNLPGRMAAFGVRRVRVEGREESCIPMPVHFAGSVAAAEPPRYN